MTSQPAAEAGPDRRSLLRTAALATGALALPVTAATAATAGAAEPPPAARRIPFLGPHQAGVTTPAQPFATFVACNVQAADRAALEQLLRTLTRRIGYLTAGGPPPDPAGDSGMLGPLVPADGLTVTVGVGASLFDQRYGLAAARPVRLTAMRAFPGDRMQDGATHGDLSLQICADSRDTVLHALRDLLLHSAGGLQLRWRIDGFQNASRPDGAQRNLMGFKDGIANPDTGSDREMDRLVWVGPGSGEPAWAVGGSYQVIRVIRMRAEAWDALPLAAQEAVIGRHKDSGAPLGGAAETDQPDFATTPQGSPVPPDAHIRLANPRNRESADSRILRRGYNYDRGADATGGLDLGLLFCCYQQDVARQFEAVQTRLDGEPLAAFTVPTGGGYFFALPGVRDEEDWLGRGLLAG
ncbi:iron uptake transporter deferrochelatase/peroxidase subunit [Kitasatospora sp. MBT63]|uniref:iron uptake transporter deferrochelatase/peroxidase subunit n=1 Tax=Kitasatospora sp. MBT63 TaxID=1444768 RepID=UPI00053AD87A|nr:iron uptake transporter deferrochelatase/peroxidase subunit [Kitasatospora sp. MBT63]